MSGAELFSKISRRMWRDQKFCSLSKPQPNARDLWIYLLSGPHSTAIPGLFVKGELGLAEDLDWDIDATRACLQEIIDAGMVRFDRPRRLMWLPNALHHNQPRSPKQVLGWVAAWRLMPECDLLREAAAGIRDILASKSAKFADAFSRVVAGQAECLDPEEEQLDDEGDGPRSDAPAQRPLPNRATSFYPIESAGSMPFQEKEKEIRERSPSGISRADAREGVGGGRASRRDQASGTRAPGRKPASPAMERRVDSVEERTILQMLRDTPSLRPVATEAFACCVADHCAEGPHTGRLRLEDLLHALAKSGRLEAEQSAAAGVSRDPRALGGYVMAIVRSTQLGDGARAAAQEAVADEAAATALVARFDAAWSRAKGGRARAHAAGDLDHAVRLVALAEDGARRSGGGITADDVIGHWIREHLRCSEKFIADAEHALRLLPGRVDSYGLPRPRVPKTPPAPVPEACEVNDATTAEARKAGASALRASLDRIGKFDPRAPAIPNGAPS